VIITNDTTKYHIDFEQQQSITQTPQNDNSRLTTIHHRSVLMSSNVTVTADQFMHCLPQCLYLSSKMKIITIQICSNDVTAEENPVPENPQLSQMTMTSIHSVETAQRHLTESRVLQILGRKCG